MGNPKKIDTKEDSRINFNANSELKEVKNKVVVKLLISDKDGHRSENVTLPTLIGKTDNACIDFGITQYISRQSMYRGIRFLFTRF